MRMSFAIGDRVYIGGVGLGEITDRAGRDKHGQPAAVQAGEAAYFFVVKAQTQVVFAPIDRANEILRPLISPDGAQAMLAILRDETIAAARVDQTRARKVALDGSPADHARLLRDLYAIEALTHSDAMTLLIFEDMVIDEIAAVLGESREALVEEMRGRYPGFARKVEQNRAGTSTDGPTVVPVAVRGLPKGVNTKSRTAAKATPMMRVTPRTKPKKTKTKAKTKTTTKATRGRK